jgi:hypothetical protein
VEIKKNSLFILYLFFYAGFLFGETRDLAVIFPNLDNAIQKEAKGKEGFSNSISKNETPITAAQLTLRIDPKTNVRIADEIINMNPAYIFESLFIIERDPQGSVDSRPHNADADGNKMARLLDVYNALSQVRKLQGRQYLSATRGKSIPLFEEATRIASEHNTKSENDPEYLHSLPIIENLYLRVKDANFGNCFYQAEIKVMPEGILYSLHNYKNINYFFVPVIKTGKLMIKLYIEPLSEGLLIYGIVGIDASDLITNTVNIPSAIQKRLNVIYGWIIDGIDQ